MSHLSARFRFALTTALAAGVATLALQPASAAVPTIVAPVADLAAAPVAAEPAAAEPAVPIEPVTAPRTRYCVVQSAVTGTVIDRKLCKTRAQWLADGFDPLEHHQR